MASKFLHQLASTPIRKTRRVSLPSEMMEQDAGATKVVVSPTAGAAGGVGSSASGGGSTSKVHDVTHTPRVSCWRAFRRRLRYWVVVNPWFERGVITAIVVNMIFVALWDPLDADPHSTRNRVHVVCAARACIAAM